MMPSTYRNVSAISLDFGKTEEERMSILMDCGEGTFSQLLDREGLDKIDRYLE